MKNLGRAICAILFGLFISGCATPKPYAFVGVCYAGDAGAYGFDEKGLCGNYGVGVEFENGVSCEVRHRSMVHDKPEVITNDGGCEYKYYFGASK